MTAEATSRPALPYIMPAHRKMNRASALNKTAILTVRLLTLSLLALAGTFWGREALAAASDWAEGDQARLRLLSASDAVGREAALQLGLEFQMRPSWKMYWRSPGDAGLPPVIY